jgi:hypothetical protein
MKANIVNATSLRQVLDQYCANSGQLVSDGKCSIYFSPNVDVQLKADICTELNILTEALSDRYLGLPAMVGVDKSDNFMYLLERVISRLNGWKEKTMSMGAEEILLKAVIQSISVFAMGVFKIPKNICKSITDAMAAFWWGDTDDHKKMHWRAWWRMCIPKIDGGMGFRDLHSFNLAMLAKQVWRLLNNPTSLCASILQAKYYPDGNLLAAGPKKGSSFTWQSIVCGIQTFKRGHIWRVGNGRRINIWRDHWVPGSVTRKIETARGNCLLRTVDDLIDPVSGLWDEQLLSEIFNPLDVRRILQIPISQELGEDFVAWHKTRNFCFSVRSAYYSEWEHQFGIKIRSNTGQSSSSSNPVWGIVWKLQVPSKVRIFIWRALHGLIPGMSILANRHIKVPAQCPICKLGAEDIMHLMFTCKRANEVWAALGLKEFIMQWSKIDKSGSVVLEEILRSDLVHPPVLGALSVKETVAVAVAVAAWYIWWQRREGVKGERVASAISSAFSIKALTMNFSLAERRATPKIIAWSKPLAGQYKLNIHACFFPNGSGANSSCDQEFSR